MGIPVTSSRNTSPVPVNTPVHRASRRQRGLPPETTEQPTDTVTMTSAQAAMEVPRSSTPMYCTVRNLLMPSPFHGELFEDVDYWLSEFEHDDAAKPRNVYSCLKDGARTWFLNRDDALTSWREFQHRLLETYRSPDHRERAEQTQKLYGPRQPEVGSITSVIRDAVQQVMHNRHYQPMPTNVEQAPVSTDIRSCTYAEALRMPISSLPVASPAVPI
ncbi:hypothetical protein HPB52_023301 [Rhipicephalus sanguineus]|uniref:Retrotransposon gag domain-containing protein n=1 Tax=Rhipicephalus sanguineus TaxID=34632 RepID=A0A9D4TC10_RHISA|nr:hypothetical protein HPB52_023301 [Rhipicephalus sanguineus]